MKKGIQEKNEAVSLWQRIRIDGRIYDLVKEPRKILGLPEEGFHSDEEYTLWRSKKKDKEVVSIVYGFIDECKKIIPYEQILTDTHFSQLLIDFFYFNEVDSELFKKWKFSGMKVKIIKDGRMLFNGSGDVENGLYIKINPFFSISQILEYIRTETEMIKSSQDLFLDVFKLKRRKKINFNPNYSRDKLILIVDEYSKKDIENSLKTKKEYKDMAISSFILDMGIKNVTPSIVKAVKEKRKLKK